MHIPRRGRKLVPGSMGNRFAQGLAPLAEAYVHSTAAHARGWTRLACGPLRIPPTGPPGLVPEFFSTSATFDPCTVIPQKWKPDFLTARFDSDLALSTRPLARPCAPTCSPNLLNGNCYA